MQLKTPGEWTKKSLLYNQQIKRHNGYNYESLAYTEHFYELNVCWQSSQTDVSVSERGRSKSEVFEAVVYDSDYKNIGIAEGDRIVIDNEKYLVHSVKSFVSYRLVTIKTECA